MSGEIIIKTAAASIAAPIICVVVSAVAGALFAVAQTLLTVMRPGIIGFFAVIIGTVAGVAASRGFCDKFLTPYHARSVFLVFVLLVIAGLFFLVAYVPMSLEQINSYVQLIVLSLMTYMVFWRGDLFS